MDILMLGNSFTAANQLPQLLAERLDAAVTAHTRGGARLAEHLNPAARMGQRTQEALRQQHFDYVVLQEMSSGPLTSPEKFRQSVEHLSSLIRASGAAPLLFATWAYENPAKLTTLGRSYEEMARDMDAAYCQAAAQNRIPVARVGLRFLEEADRHGLYGPDGVHPSERGTRLAAEELARSIQLNSAL